MFGEGGVMDFFALSSCIKVVVIIIFIFNVNISSQAF